MAEIGRNDPCACGSGKKYKNCCLLKKNTKPMGLKGRKFTAKVLSGPNAQTNEAQSEQKSMSPVDYNVLMERSFGNALKKFPETPPVPENPEDYLKKEDESTKK